MAKHIPFGHPVNDSEKWAFRFLEENLPDHYQILTNVEVTTNDGGANECDAIVIGEFAIYLIDVKGYVGQLEAGKDVWVLNGREIENSYPKVSWLARVLAERMRRAARGRLHTPWVQGVVFATGREGSDISVGFPHDRIGVRTAEDIVAALTLREYCTSPGAYRVEPLQVQLARDVIGQVALVERRNARFGDFQKTKRLLSETGYEVWTALYVQDDWSSQWLLKVVIPHQIEDKARRGRLVSSLRKEFVLYQELRGLAGIPYAAPIMDDGEVLVLPIRMPLGRPIGSIDPTELGAKARAETIRSIVISLQGIHRRGVSHGRLTGNSIFVHDDHQIELIDLLGSGARIDDLRAIAKLLEPWLVGDLEGLEEEFSAVGEVASPEDVDQVFESIRYRLAAPDAAPQPTADAPRVTFELGSIVDEKYQLVELLSGEPESGLWKAIHTFGSFQCVIQIYDRATEDWEGVRESFRRALSLYHPNLERVFDLDQLEDTDFYYVSRAWVPGRAIGADRSVEKGQVVSWFRKLLTVLQYMHRLGVVHRNITPSNIIIDDGEPVLVGLHAYPATEKRLGDLRYKDPLVIERGWRPQSDLYTLCTVFGLLSCTSDSRDIDVANIAHQLQRGDCRHLSTATQRVMAGILLNPGEFDPGDNYLGFFALEERSRTLEKLPNELRSRWHITPGYMEFLVVDMLKDGRPRSRQQWVLNALRTRRIPGNKTNRGSMNATISRLKSTGVGEIVGKKVQLTKSFADDALKTLGDLN